MKKKILIALGVLLGVVYVSNIIIYELSPKPYLENTPIPTSTVQVIATHTPTPLLDEYDIVNYLDELLIEVCPETHDLSYELGENRNILTVRIWDSTTTSFAWAATKGIEPHATEWEKFSNDIIQGSKNWHELFLSNGHDVMVYINYVNPNNTEEYYISAVNGVLVFDGPRGIDLMDQLFGE